MGAVIRRAAVLVATCSVAVVAVAAPRFVFEAVPSPEGFQLAALGDWNDAGQVAAVWSAAGTTPRLQASLYTPGLGHDFIGPAVAEGLRVQGLNASGQVVGSVGTFEDARAWWLAPVAGPVDGVAASGRSGALAVNDAGVVVGHRERADGLTEPFVALPGAAPRTIGPADGGAAIDVNDRGEVLVMGYGDPSFHLYRYDIATDTLTDVRSDGPSTFLSARMNDRGDIAVTFGRRDNAAGIVHADGRFTPLAGLPGFANASTDDINDLGQVLGESANPEPGSPHERRPFLYTPDAGTVDPLSLSDMPDGWTGVTLSRLDPTGSILGTGVFAGDSHAFVLRSIGSPVPEPATWAMLALGLWGVAAALAARRGGRP